MRTLTLVWGIVVISFAFIALVPCLGWMNWFVIPIAMIGAVLAIIDLATNKDQQNIAYPIAGLICCLGALPISIVRLIVGVGII